MNEVIDAEIVPSKALTPFEDSHTYRPTLVLAPEEARTLVEQVKAMQRSVLVEGVDYMTISGTSKPSLLKPGAERLMQVFGLGHRMEQLDVQRGDDGKPTGVTYRCTVTKMMMDGRELTVSSCDGHASMEEPKWRKAPWNTIIKMAQKRALVGACLTATATSGLFTQDMEDTERAGSTPSSSERQHHESAPTDSGSHLTEKQVTLIQMLFKDLGIGDREDRLALASIALARNVESTKDLTKTEASVIIEYLKARLAEVK